MSDLLPPVVARLVADSKEFTEKIVRGSETMTEYGKSVERANLVVRKSNLAAAESYDRATVALERSRLATEQAIAGELSWAEANRVATTAVRQAERADIAAAEAKAAHAAAAEKSAGRMSRAVVTAGKVGAVALAVIAVASLKMAGDFEQATNVFVTAAGESADGLKVVRQGIKDIARETGTTWQNLAEGEYLIEKAGYRGAEGLQVLRAAAQGAREENAQLADVTNAMTSVMASYHLQGSDSVRVMNALKTAAGEGKLTMQEFSSALATVIPIASANNVSFAEVGGAIATLTQHGTSAREATQELAATIRALAAPNRVAQNEMQQLGLSVTDVSKNVGQRGLTGTLDLLTRAITSHMGPAGLVLLNAFNQSKSAAADANVMIENMPGPLQRLAREYQNGTITLGDWRKILRKLPADQAALAMQYGTLQNKASGFNSLLRAGDPAAQTYTDALKKMTGGAIGLNTSLQLTGGNMPGFVDRVEKVGKSYNDASKDVEGWASTQKLFNVQLDKLKQSAEVAGITLGTKLIPIMLTAMQWAEKHTGTLKVLAFVIGTLLVAATVAWTVALLANPVVWVVAGLMALGVAFKYAWDHSAKFRVVVAEAMQVASHVIRFFVDSALNYFDIFIHGASLLFGWVPGVGGHLKDASRAFDRFKNDIDGAFDSIDRSAAAFANKQKLHADATAAAIVGPMITRLPQYKAIAEKYGVTLDEVLKQAGYNAKERSAAMGDDVGQKFIAKANHAILSGKQSLSETAAAVIANAGNISAASGRGGALGKAFMDGINAGIRKGNLSLSEAAASVVANADAAARKVSKTHSPSLVWMQHGKNLVDGLVAGMRSEEGKAAQAAADVAASATAAFTRATKALKDKTAADHAAETAALRHAQALSREAHAATLAAQAMPAHTKAQKDARDAALHHARALTELARQAGVTEANLSRADREREKSLRAVADAARKAADAAAAAAQKAADDAKKAAQTILEAAIKAAQGAVDTQRKAIESMQADLDGLIGRRDQFVQSLTGGIGQGQGDLASIFKSLTDDLANATEGSDAFAAAQARANDPVGAITATLTDQLAQAKAFSDELEQLTAEGASEALLSQIAQAGVQAGGALAAALLSTGPESVRSISGLMQQISDVGLSAAQRIAASFYQPGIDSMTNLIMGMQSKESALEAEVTRIEAILQQLSDAEASIAASEAALGQLGGPPAAGGGAGGGGSSNTGSLDPGYIASISELLWTASQRDVADARGIGGNRSQPTSDITIIAMNSPTPADIANELAWQGKAQR